MHLPDLGFDTHFQQLFAGHHHDGALAARVAREDRHSYLLYSGFGPLTAELAGRLRHEARWKSDLPAVGDWVAIRPRPGDALATIVAILPRRTCFSRKIAGATTDEQVLAANIDTVLLLCGLDHDFNPRRIERYIGAAYASGATPVIILNKADLRPDADECVAEVRSLSPGVAVHAISAADGTNIDVLSPYISPGRTVALLGSSGVGKSTLVNRLLGLEYHRTSAVRGHDSHGRHTTTHRELIILPSGGMLIDTPGMRELALWADERTLEGGFDDVEQLIARCRFTNCRHRTEPGCAIRAAIEEGSLDPARFDNYLKLQRELAHLAARQDERQRDPKQQWTKQIAKWQRQRMKLPPEMRRGWGV